MTAGGGREPDALLTLHRLSLGYRILYTGVLLFVVLGIGAGLLQQELRAGLTPEGVAQWHLGNAGDPDATTLLFAATPHEVLDRVWRRSLANLLPMVVLLAVFFRSGVTLRTKAAAGGALVLAALVDTAAPALVRYGGAGFGVVAFGAQLAVAAAAAGIAGRCVWEMWARRTAGPRFHDRLEGRR